MTLAYRIYGAIDAPPLVLLHPIGTSQAIWAFQIPIFTTMCRVVAIDLPGHGESDATSDNAGFTDWADAVLATLEHVQIDAASFVGLSLGGMVAQAIALRAPERVMALVLACCGAKTSAETAGRWEERIADVRSTGMASQVEPTLDRWLTPAFSERAPTTRAWIASLLEQASVEGYAAAARAIQRLDHLDRLRSLVAGGSVDLPTSVIIGRHDASVPPAAGHAIAEAMNAQTIELDAGHLANVEAATDFSEAVARFVAGRARIVRSARGTIG